jgi:transketolase C-terminal domain/subunit
MIRDDIGYHLHYVESVCVSGGVAYGLAGDRHHSVGDLAVMRAMPNINSIGPIFSSGYLGGKDLNS